jgi:hypothetical protein
MSTREKFLSEVDEMPDELFDVLWALWELIKKHHYPEFPLTPAN